MRALLIGAGLLLLARFHWIMYLFAALLVFSAVRMLFGKGEEQRLVEKSCALCSSWVGKLLPIRQVTEGPDFLVKRNGRWMATPLLVALVVIETSDLVFALDSIPAVFAITRDPFLVYTSNIFALLGLRSLYFVLAGSIQELRFLRAGLAVMLLAVAGKILVGDTLRTARLGIAGRDRVDLRHGNDRVAPVSGTDGRHAILEKLLHRVEHLERLAWRQRVGIERFHLSEQCACARVLRFDLPRCRACEKITLVVAPRGELVEPREIRFACRIVSGGTPASLATDTP